MYEGLFRALKKEKVRACVISSRRGTPIAWYGIERKKIDTISTLSAAMYGASLVLHRESELPSPDIVMSDSDDKVFMIKGMKNGNILAVIGEGDQKKIMKDMNRVIDEFGGAGL